MSQPDGQDRVAARGHQPGVLSDDNPESVVGVPWNENGYAGGATTCLCPHAGLACCETESVCCSACENEGIDRLEDDDEWD